MKKILVATDFSKASISAGEYARSLATAFNSGLILFNVYDALPKAVEKLVPVEDIDFRQEAMRNLIAQAQSLESHGLPYCYTHVDEGEIVDTILRKVTDEKVDLVVMGMKLEHKNFRKLFGSTVSSLCKQSPVPVLIVPEFCQFKKINAMALAVEHDCDEQVSPRLLDVFRELAERFKPAVYVVKVFGDHLKNDKRFHHKPYRLIKMIRTTEPVFDTIDGNDVAEALLQYIENREINLLATLPHRLQWIEKIVTGRSITKQLIFTAHIPLLIMPQMNNNHISKYIES